MPNDGIGLGGGYVDVEVGTFLREWNQVRTADNDDRMRGIRNTMAYCSLDSGQWPLEMKQDLRMAGREAKQYNFLQYIVRGHCGNVMMNWVDPSWNLREEGPMDAVDALGKVYFANKEHNDFKAETMSCYEDGFAYRGVQELRIIRPTPNPRTWSIGFPHIRSDMVIFDPHNTSDRISRNSQVAWKMSMQTALNMAVTWNRHTDKILEAIVRQDEKEGNRYTAFDLQMFSNLEHPDLMTNQHLVVEKLWIKQQKVTMRFLRLPNGLPDLINPLPETGYKIGSPEDVAVVQDWALQNGMVLTDEMIAEITDWKKVNWITTVCPSLGILLEDRKDERQLDGHIPLYCWSFIQKRGKSVGLIDLLWDTQQDFNRREMAMTKILTQTPISGKPWVSEDIVREDGDQTLEQVVEEFNDGSKPQVIPGGTPADRLMGILPGTNVPSSLFQDLGMKLDLADRIASLPQAMQGMTSRSGESGVHFGRKVIEGSIMNRMPQEWIMQHENDKAEDWTIMGIKLYGHPANVNREFKFNKGQNSVIINHLKGYDEDGREVYENHIGALKRVDVIISQTSENQFMRQARAESSQMSLQSIPPTPTNDIIRAAFECELARNQDFRDEEARSKAEEAADLRYKLAKTQAMVQLKTLEQQLQGPSPQEMLAAGAGRGAPGGGAPQPGGPEQPEGVAPPSQAPGREPVTQTVERA